ncbi:280_t:CDS:2, partial [Gigaspora rosea]
WNRHCRPLPRTSQGNRYIVVATDYMTKWPKAKAIETANANEVADFIYKDIVSCLSIYPSETEELLERMFLQRLFKLIKIVPQFRATAVERVENAQKLAKNYLFVLDSLKYLFPEEELLVDLSDPLEYLFSEVELP